MDVISGAVVLQGKHVQRSAAVRRKVSPARFSVYVNPGMNPAIPTRGRSKWMMRTKTTASRRSMKLLMLTVLLIESECIKQRTFIAFIIVINFIHVIIEIKKYYALRFNKCYGTTFDLEFDLGPHK